MRMLATRSDFGSYTSMPAPLGQGLRVLVVEDDDVQALVLLLFLERLGVAATHVRDGEDAIDAVQSHDYAIVLMDYQLPSINGIEATRAIRRWENATARKPVPIVAVTASAMQDECRSYLDAGMNGVLVKPYSAGELREVLMHHLTTPMQRKAP
jgi:CheY-like chemotaxis protein